ncbi:cell division protein PerM [Dietzia psychralcaliphila]|uniref:cell division protein PerM n=1 Tax=Dietzia psychralcaliphila TaxID=139021 RepID=UPI0027E1E273|nr:DUF6350 family protein [Dietzia psychralcaliphila]
MSPPRVIRPAARRTPAGAGSLLWTAAAAALPVIVTVLVLVAVTLAFLVFSARGFDSLFAVVAVEWMVVNRVPLTVDAVSLGFLPLLPPLIYVAVLARQTRAVLADVEQPGPREAGAAVAGVTLAGMLLTVLASLLVGSAASDFAVREVSLPTALLWSVAVALFGSGLGVWLYFRRDLREVLPLWVRGGIHLGSAFVAALWAMGAILLMIGLLVAWGPVGSVLEIGKGFTGTAALTAISIAYLPNVVMAAATLAVGGEAHLGEASYSVFAVSRGPMPEVPLAAALPTTDPHWVMQALLLVTVLVAAGLARAVAHWFRTTADAVKAAWLAAAIVALVVAVSPVVAGGELGVLGTVGTGSMIAAGTALALFGVIGSATIALSLAGLTRRRERAESELERRRRRAGTVPGEEEMEAETGAEPAPEPEPESAPVGPAVVPEGEVPEGEVPEGEVPDGYEIDDDELPAHLPDSPDSESVNAATETATDAATETATDAATETATDDVEGSAAAEGQGQQEGPDEGPKASD